MSEGRSEGRGTRKTRFKGRRVESTGHCLRKCTATEDDKNERTNAAQQKESPERDATKDGESPGRRQRLGTAHSVVVCLPEAEVDSSHSRGRRFAAYRFGFYSALLPDYTTLSSMFHERTFEHCLPVMSELTPTTAPPIAITKHEDLTASS